MKIQTMKSRREVERISEKTLSEKDDRMIGKGIERLPNYYKQEEHKMWNANLLAESENCMQSRSCVLTPLGKLTLESKNSGDVNITLYPRSLCSSRPIKPYQFQADLI